MKPPFEGDTFLEQWMLQVIHRWNISRVVETGTETGATANWFSQRTPFVFTCDVKDLRQEPTNLFPRFFLGESHKMLDEIYCELADWNVLFWLDAHQCPDSCALPDELEVIASHKHHGDRLIAIHDFQVPGHDELGYDSYNGLGNLCLKLVEPYMVRIYPNGYTVSFNTCATGAKRGVALFSPL